ncbi:MAG: outer membrane protein assembly factor BamA [Bauldia sp.]
MPAATVAMPALLALLVPGPAQAAVASSIAVEGNQRVDAETIKAYITIKPGKAYGAADIDESVKILYGTGLFADVLIDQRGSVLVVVVAENPIVNSVTFEGNKKLKANILVEVVDLKTRGVLTDARLKSDIARIEEYYARSGRSGAQVDARVTQLGENRVDVVFLVYEGDRTGVASITFVGNSVFSSTRLSRTITTRKTNWLSWLNKRDVYGEEKLQADEDALRRFYLEHGYADFQLLDAQADFDEANGVYHVTFTIDEGPKYRYGEITIDSSVPGVDSAALAGFVSTKSGKVFDSSEVETSVEDLTIELSRMGYVFAQVNPRGDRDYANNVIAITYVIDEGPRAYVERIEIYGNTKTRDYVIRREFVNISEGDAYNRVLIDQAERRLRDLGYFKTVSITTRQGSAPDKVVLLVNVEDQSTGSFSIAGGVSTTEGLIAEVALEETNFLGRGQTLRIAVGGGFNDQTYNLSFTDPYFLGYHVSAGFDLYRNVSSRSSLRPFTNEITGGGLRLGLPLTDNMSLGLNYKIANQMISGGAACDPDGSIAGPPATVTGCYFPNGTRLTSSAGYSFLYSTVDSTLDPREGLFVKFAQDFAGVGGDAAFMRSVADARWYHPIGSKSDVVGLLRITGGNITGLGMPVAIQDNFFKGGETVRGFAPLGYGPRDTTLGPTGGMALGGKNFWAATAEVQFPLPMLPPDFGLRGAVFADAGMLFGVDTPAACLSPPAAIACSITSDTVLRSSVGASILWASPFGQLRVDFAQALSKASYDNTQFVRIGAGATF